jgi:periplasmic divalent cation tolerance protein
MSLVLAYITAKDKEEARQIAKNLLEKRLAACVNLMGNMESHFWWKDQLEKSDEVVLIAKTSAEKQDELCELVKQVHSYDCPCVLFLPLIGGAKDYLKWMEQELK